MRRDDKVEVRIGNLVKLMEAELPDAVAKAQEIWERGQRPNVVRVRRSYLRLEQFGGVVIDERKPLPREKRPISAQMIAPKGLSLKLHLLMLFAAQCEVAPGKKWPVPYPAEPTPQQPDSWMGLAASVAQYAGPGVQASSVRTNKLRQVAEAMKALEKKNLVESVTGVAGQVKRGILLGCENGRSTRAASIPYTVPTDDEAYIEIPTGFFTRGWVHVLTMSEIAAILMWLDILKFDSRQITLPGATQPVTMGFVNSRDRHGWYGLGRETYETHQPLRAFQLLEVYLPPQRHLDGKWEGYHDDHLEMAHHKIVMTPEGFDREAGKAVLEILRRRHTTGEWGRALGW
ncbi:hypothetical protein [Streptomyces yangpuensis]|uniref:hypothetical protein n=1 Tax=Streptomyces yangpuensis TaxID=1648182 RepID=UPI000AEFB183|nr:hypothetical protein [Streptomyces yangpuensis]